MFTPVAPKTSFGGFVKTAELIFHIAIRDIRKSHGNAVIGLLLNIVQSVTLVLFFWAMFTVLGMRSTAVRGDFLLYSMSGIFMYMTHIKAIKAVAMAEGPTNAMMKHAPMNTIVTIGGQALATLYQQVLAIAVILFFYHTCFQEFTIDEPIPAMGMILLAWFSGLCIGMVFKAATPWAPDFFAIANSVYTRINVIASGKMFLANATPTWLLSWFWWNPLFHVIDQQRGFVFLNYNPHYSSIAYPIWVSCALLVLGFMGDSFTRKYASLSWVAGR